MSAQPLRFTPSSPSSPSSHPLAERLGREIDASVADAAAIHAPFDREIVNPAGRKRVAATVKALKVQTATLVQAARALGIPSLNVSG